MDFVISEFNRSLYVQYLYNIPYLKQLLRNEFDKIGHIKKMEFHLPLYMLDFAHVVIIQKINILYNYLYMLLMDLVVNYLQHFVPNMD